VETPERLRRSVWLPVDVGMLDRLGLLCSRLRRVRSASRPHLPTRRPPAGDRWSSWRTVNPH